MRAFALTVVAAVALSVVAVVFPVVASPPACPLVAQHNVYRGGSTSSFIANYFQGSAFTATETLRISRLGLYVSSANVAMRIGIYTESGGRPGTLLAQTGSFLTTTSSTGNYVSVSSSPSPGIITEGQRYWIVGIWASSCTVWNEGTGRFFYNNGAYPSGMSSNPPGTVSTFPSAEFFMAGTCQDGRTCSGGTSCVCPTPPTSVCYPTNSTGCGLQSNACGSTRACGSACGTDRTCSAVNPATQPGTCTCDAVPASACYPTNGTGCGLQSNACGNTRACGSACGADRSCSAVNPATQPGTCTCDAVPASVCMANGGKTCGRVSNACGNSQDCGLTNCGQDETCNATDPATSAGVCACDAVPASACTGLCGVITNACGASRDCGTGACVAGAVCNFLSNQCQFASGSPSSPPPSPSPSSGTPATPSPGDGQAGGDESAGGSGDGAFPWWYIVAAAAGCCCCILLVAAAIFFVRRRRKDDDADPSSSSDGIAMAATVGAPSGMGTPGATQGGAEHYGPIAATPVAGSIYARFDASSIGASVGGPGSGSLSPGGGGGDAKGPSVDPAQLQKGEELGRGEYGVVYKGTYQGEEVAIKHMIKDYDAAALREFYAEAELMGKIGAHPNVLRFIGLALTTEGGGGNGGAGAAIVTEFCAGSSLLNAILATPLEEDTLWFVVRGMAAGMAHLAASHVTHRDLACRNVLLGADWTPKICDFGMSRLTDAGSTQATTKTDTGPIKWMAPEALEHRQYSEKSDVWMFGATVNETVSRKEPHPDKTAMEVGTQIILRRLQPVAVDGTPAAMVPVVNACFAFEPADRPTFADIVARLG